MTEDNNQTKSKPSEFDFSHYPPNTLFHERRTGSERRKKSAPVDGNANGTTAPGAVERRARKERRRRIDPTTFEKQYTEEEMEFMNAMQRFKELSGKNFPTHGDVLRVAVALGYRRVDVAPEPPEEGLQPNATVTIPTSLVEN
jgi:hypothetical protein